MTATTQTIDLLEIAQIERKGGAGNLFNKLDENLKRSDIKPNGHDDAVIWEIGNFGGDVNPLAHALTDKFSLVGTLAALEVLGLPSYLVPMMAQYRHDMELAPLAWFGNMPGYGVKWSTAGDFMVDDGKGGTCVVAGKSGNAKLRTDAGVYCNVRSIEIAPGKWIRNVRSMPMLPYSQDKKAFTVKDNGIVHTEINTPGDRIAYACRQFLSMVNDLSVEHGELGRGAIKPTQAMEDGIMAGLLTWMLQHTSFNIRKTYQVDAYLEHKERIDKIITLLPDNFLDGMQDWTGDIYLHIADTNYGLMLHDMMDQNEVVVLSTDLDGDRLTDLMADAPKAMIRLVGITAKHLGSDKDAITLWREMGFHATTGMDMPSIMYRKEGLPIYEMTLGSADAMLDRILDGHELADNAGNRKYPYNPRIHFSLTIEAAKVANPDHKELHEFLDNALATFDELYQPGNIPLFFEGIAQLKERITPWNA